MPTKPESTNSKLAPKITKTERGLFELYRDDPVRADAVIFGRMATGSRRGFLQGAGLTALATVLGGAIPFARNMPMGLIPAALAQSDIPDGEFIIPGKEGLTIVGDRPLNAEPPAHLLDPAITPIKHFFVRNHGIVPDAQTDPDEWTLSLDGEVQSPQTLTLGEIKKKFKIVRMQAVLECAGNGRSGYQPAARGTQWTVGAVGNAEWTGVRLADVLRSVGLKSSAVYTAHYGADPHLSGDPDQITLSRGVPIAKAMDPATLLIFGMNGEPLPLLHGAPLRLLAPGWIASASQKWLKRIWIRDREHDGPGMTGSSYRMPRSPMAPGEKTDDANMAVITSLPIKSLITSPATGASIDSGVDFEIRGHAWTGVKTVKAVHVSTDFGATWTAAALERPANPYAWQRWKTSLRLPQRGYYEIWARATDEEGRMQPAGTPGWNPQGYLNNAQHRIAVRAV
jgi:DMSO/TMAO reductase YedYZ molybdopterin-dependent catalytic subunit